MVWIKCFVRRLCFHFFINENLSSFRGNLTFCNFYCLQEIAIYCSELLADAEEDLLTLLNEPDESIKEDVVHLMSKAGAFFRNKGSSTEGRR